MTKQAQSSLMPLLVQYLTKLSLHARKLLHQGGVRVSKRFSVWLLAIGVLFVVIAIVLWTAVAPVLTKLPNDVNTSMEFEGTMTLLSLIHI